MILTISGLHGTGKSTIGKMLAENYNLQYYSTGQAFRDLAKEKGMDLETFSKFAEEHPEIDKELDQKVIDIAKQDDIIVDSQLSGFLLKDIADVKILLTAPFEVRVKRMMERDSEDYEEKIKETKAREESEQDRFKRLYHIDLSDENKFSEVYNLIFSTENLSIDEVFDKLVSLIDSQIGF